MNGLPIQTALLDLATDVLQFAGNWFLQSAVLITIGLAVGRLVARRGSAAQSAVYRTTLVAVLVCPLASWLLALAGVSGWSLAIPRPFTAEPAMVIVAASVEPAPQPIPTGIRPVTKTAAPTPLSKINETAEQGAGIAETGAPPTIPLTQDDIRPLVASQPPVAGPATQPAESPTFSLPAFGSLALGLCAAWLAITAVSFARLSVGWWQMTRLRSAAVAVDVITWQTCHELAKKLAVPTPEVLRSAYLPSPCLAGIRRPVVLLPEVDLSLSIRDVLVHELAHLVRRDCHWNLLRLAALSAFWFQPLLWKLSRRLEMTAEEVCDDYVMHFGGDRFEYAYRLVDIAELCSAPMAAAGVGIVSLRSMLARRVQRIMDPSRPRSTRAGNLLLTVVVVGGLIGTAIVGLVGIHPQQSVAEVPPVATEDKSSDEPAESAASEPAASEPQSTVAENTPPAAQSSPAPATVAAPETPGAEAVPAEAIVSAPRPQTITTIGFERDPVQLSPGPFDVSSLSFSGNDQFLAAGGGGMHNDQNPGQARIWDFPKAKEVASYPTARGVDSVALSPDGKRVALCAWSDDVWLYEIGGPELLHEHLSGHPRVAFSPDGKLLVAVTEHNQLRTWDGVTGRSFEKDNDADGKAIENKDGAFRGGTFPFCWVGFSPDGKYLVACGGKKREEGGIKFAVWSVASRLQLYKKATGPEQIFSASISPDSQTLATSGRNSIALWDLATGVLRTETDETPAIIDRVDFSPDGKLLASAGYGSGGTVTLWNPTTGKIVGTLNGHERPIRAMAFTRDGKTLATGGTDQSLRLWDVATRQQLSMLQGPDAVPGVTGPSNPIVAVAYSPDGRSVATAHENGKVNLYGPAPFGLSRSWNAHADAAAAITWSPDGKTLVTGGFDKLVKIWDPATGDLIRTLSGHANWVNSLAFSSDGQTLASGSYDRSIRLWNVADGAEGKTLTGHAATIRSLAFSHDDRLLASGSADQTVRLWDAASGQQQASLAGHQGAVRSVAFSADDRLLASGGEDQTVKVWNVDSRDLRGTLTGHTDMVSAVAFVQQTLVSTSWDHTYRTWDADALELRGKITVGPSEVAAMAVSADGRRMLTASADQTVTLWRSTLVEGRRSGPLGEYRTFPWTAEFSPDGTTLAVAAGGFDEETDLYLYDVATKAEKYKVTFPDSVRSIAFAPAGDLITLGFARKRILLVDAARGHDLAEVEAQPADAQPAQRIRYARVAYSPDGKLLAATANDNLIRIYDVANRALLRTLRGHKERVLSIAFSPDQKRLVSGSQDRTVIVWDLENAERRYALPPQPGYVGVGSVSFSPDGKLLATGSGQDVACLWNAETGSLLHTLNGHRGQVYEAVFSPDGKTLATGAEDGLVKLWDVETGQLSRTYECQSGKILCVRFSPDGKSFVTTGRDGDARLWWVLPPETK